MRVSQAIAQVSKSNRSSHVWAAYRHYDMPGYGDAASISGASIPEVKEKCAKEGYGGFSLRDGKAYLKAAWVPLRREDLEFMGEDDSVVFFTLSPPRRMAWTMVHNCDYPNKGDTEAVKTNDLEALKRLAEGNGYTGFSVRDDHAYMKVSDLPITREDLQCKGVGECTFYLPDPAAEVVGVAPWDQTHREFKEQCSVSASNTSCATTKCCANSDHFCMEHHRGMATCRTDCPGRTRGAEPWACKVLGASRALNLSMFCFTVVASDTPEFQLVKGQLMKGAGIAGCDGYRVFSDREVELGNGDYTTPLRTFTTRPSSQLSLRTHYEAWVSLLDHYLCRPHIWCVKVDPRTLFFPNQLKAYLQPSLRNLLQKQAPRGIYLRTCVNHEGKVSKLSSALEVLSDTAVTVLNNNRGSFEPDPQATVAEDVWLQSFFDKHAVPSVDAPIVADGTCLGAEELLDAPCNFSKVAFYPLRAQQDMDRCSNQANGFFFTPAMKRA